MTAGQLMTKALRFAEPGTTEQEAMAMMTEGRFRHLPVVANGQLVGLISIGDISRWVADAHRAEAEHLRNYISGGLPA